MGKLKMTAGFIISIIQIFLYLNADFVYGAYADVARNIILSELLIVIVLAVFSRFDLTLLFRGPQDVTNAILVFLGASFALTLIPFALFSEAQIETATIVAGVGWIGLHAIVIAFNEEIAFRGILDSFLPPIVQSGMFAVFHVGVKGGNMITLIVLLALGMIFTYIRRWFGVMASVSAHFAWNLKAMGVLDMLMFGM